jgi:hypothetical protein
MSQFPQATGQAATDLAQAFSLGQLTKEYRQEVIPGAESFGKAFCLMLSDQDEEFITIEQLNQLTEQACMTYHRTSPPFLGWGLCVKTNIPDLEDVFNLWRCYPYSLSVKN